MALFGTSDDYVPILTAFYQAEFDAKNPVGGDLDVLVQRYVYNEPHTLNLWSEGREYAEADLRHLAKTHMIIHQIILAAAIQEIPDPRDKSLPALNKLIKSTLTTPQVRWKLSENSGQSRAYIGYEVEHYRPKRDAPGSDINSFTGMVLTSLIQAIERNNFYTCEECLSIFAASRQGVRYCSRRCAERFGNRKRREEKKINQTPD